MSHTALNHGIVTCPCGSASFVAVNTYPVGNFQFRMVKNWDLTLTFETPNPPSYSPYEYKHSRPDSIFCAGCGEQVVVSPAVTVRGGDRT